MKKVLFASIVSLFASVSFAGQQENFQTCAASDSSWMNRWGRYVVSFDRNEAYDICAKQTWPQVSRGIGQTGCYHGGSFIEAGFYCLGPAGHR